MNILSYDIEEWYIEEKFNGARSEKYKEFDNYLDSILDTLDKYNLKATFFCLGKIATNFPYVIKKIASHGHDIGCHSNEHIWLTKMSHKQLLLDTKDAISALEDCCGQKIESFRAPAFSIGENNKWAFEILSECGIKRDSSIFPAIRDFGGFNGFPTQNPSIIEYNGIKIKEFPIMLASIFNKKVAYSGGGYFRFFPYLFISENMKKNNYNICYFHIGDLIYNKEPMMTKIEYETYFQEKGSFLNRSKRHFKSTIGTKTAFDKMTRLLSNFNFINISQADSLLNWDEIETFKI